MQQQLFLFPDELRPVELQSSQNSGSLLVQTRELFQHQGSNAELIDRIMMAVSAIDELRQKSSSEIQH